MSNKFNYVLLIFSILTFITSLLLFLFKNQQLSKLTVIDSNNLYTNEIGNTNSKIDTSNLDVISLILSDEFQYKSLIINDIQVKNLSSSNLITKNINFNNTSIIAKNVTNNQPNLISDKKFIYGTVLFSFYNSASLYYSNENFDLNTSDNCIILYNTDGSLNIDNSKLGSCDKYLQIYNINKQTCDLPIFYGSSPIADINDNTNITAKNGYVCKGLSNNCNNSPENIWNQKSIYWNMVLIYDNKEIIDYNPNHISLYYTYPYFYAFNVKINNDKTLNTPLLYSGLFYNASNITNYNTNQKIGSSYIWGQDYENETQLFYNSNRSYIYDTFNNKLIGTENQCIYTCNNNDCLLNINNYGICSCNIPYTSNYLNYNGNLNFSNNQNQNSKVLAIYKYCDENNNKEYTYISSNGVSITIKHKLYPENYKSDKKKNFGSMKYNGHESLSSYKITQNYDSSNTECGIATSFSSINPFDFGETIINLNYANLRLTKIPIVECYLQSNIEFSFHAGYCSVCSITDITQVSCNVVIRNYPHPNLKSSSSLNGFQLYYNIYYDSL